jgi:ubiquinone/menaquinone biosynthesis C-methylase UbiE
MGNEVAREFWKASNGQAFGTTLATDPAFRELNEEELAQIASLLPPLGGRRVLELGGGIGRFTRMLAEAAASVTVLDISPGALEQNRARNRSLANVHYEVADVSSRDLGRSEYDLVFCNWLLMYLDEGDTRVLLDRVARSLRRGGCFFVRESCHTNYRGRGHFAHVLTKDLLLGFLPPLQPLRHMTYNFWRFRIPSLKTLLWFLPRSGALQTYREAVTYEAWFRDHFEIVREGFIGAYVRRYQNKDQRFWLLEPRTGCR